MPILLHTRLAFCRAHQLQTFSLFFQLLRRLLHCHRHCRESTGYSNNEKKGVHQRNTLLNNLLSSLFYFCSSFDIAVVLFLLLLSFCKEPMFGNLGGHFESRAGLVVEDDKGAGAEKTGTTVN